MMMDLGHPKVNQWFMSMNKWLTIVSVDTPLYQTQEAMKLSLGPGYSIMGNMGIVVIEKKYRICWNIF